MTTKSPVQRFSKEFCTQKMKANTMMRGPTVPTTGKEKTRNQRVTQIQLLTIKPINNKNNKLQESQHTYQY
jgi:hypothetical protein